MPPTGSSPTTDSGANADPACAAAAARAGIDTLLLHRAPGAREAFWSAVALLYARGVPPDAPADPARSAPDLTRSAGDGAETRPSR